MIKNFIVLPLFCYIFTVALIGCGSSENLESFSNQNQISIANNGLSEICITWDQIAYEECISNYESGPEGGSIGQEIIEECERYATVPCSNKR